MTAIINGSSPTVTFSDGTTQTTSAIVSGYVPYANLPAGSVLQVVNANNTGDSTTASSTYANTNITASITPKYSTSKILAIVDVNGILKTSSDTYGLFRLTRDGSPIIFFGGYLSYSSSTGSLGGGGCSCTILDNPATTSAVTYTVQFASVNNTGTIYVNLDAYSTITLMEIAG